LVLVDELASWRVDELCISLTAGAWGIILCFERVFIAIPARKATFVEANILEVWKATATALLQRTGFRLRKNASTLIMGSRCDWPTGNNGSRSASFLHDMKLDFISNAQERASGRDGKAR